MTEDLIHAQYDITKKSKLKKFYERYKILIFSTIVVLIISFASFAYYVEKKESLKIKLSDSYVEARILLERGDKNEAKKILKDLIFTNDSTYSTLAFFIVLNNSLITDYKELDLLFEHILTNNKFDEEIKNLLIYKRAIFNSDFLSESELLDRLKSILNEDSLWKPHALILLGDYFVSKKEYLKAKEFYSKTLSIKNLQRDLYDHVRFQLSLINNE